MVGWLIHKEDFEGPKNSMQNATGFRMLVTMFECLCKEMKSICMLGNMVSGNHGGQTFGCSNMWPIKPITAVIIYIYNSLITSQFNYSAENNRGLFLLWTDHVCMYGVCFLSM